MELETKLPRVCDLVEGHSKLWEQPRCVINASGVPFPSCTQDIFMDTGQGDTYMESMWYCTTRCKAMSDEKHCSYIHYILNQRRCHRDLKLNEEEYHKI